MRSIIDAYKKTGSLHHAYLIEGDKECVLPELYEMLESVLEFPVKGNPDFWHGEFDTFGIGESRELKEMQSRKPVAGERKIFVVSVNFFTTEAQNALLKAFEEPVKGTHFFIITPHADALLPTLRSRLFTIAQLQGTAPDRESEDLAKDFLKSEKVARLSLVKNIIDAKDKNKAISFLNALEAILHERLQNIRCRTSNVLEEILKCRGYLRGRAPSVKMILEHIAMVVPEHMSKRN
ncbi:MAG: hypothetical protein BMS9Abin13_513 [Patescibacteria group bacterium]|nr:MAG: hypothetical protein BMS9Abin13_513 [Patescibacteria group bacterium]